MKLTEQQAKIVESNHNLIYGFAHFRNLDLEEWYGLLAIQLCETVLKWDDSRGKLSTLYYLHCDSLVRNEYVRRNAQKNQDGGLLSLDYEYQEGNNEPYDMEDMFEHEVRGNSIYDIVNKKNTLEELSRGKYGEIFQLRYEGYTQEEIADIVGLSQPHISRILSDKLEEYELERGR